LPRIGTLQRWREEAPEGFEFTLKTWHLITREPSSPPYRRLKTPRAPVAHERLVAFRPTPEVCAAWETTLACARALAAHIIVSQSLASFTATPQHVQNLRALFSRIKRDAEGLPLAWEPRGWILEQAEAICEELGITRVVDPFKDTPPTRGLRYFRLHGVTGDVYQYSDTDLENLQVQCRGALYCLFNNTSMAEDARRFLTCVGR
jgi:uncharacterized protein YecE (DUF72 family)